MRAIGLVAIILLLVFILPVCADDAGTGDLTLTFTTSKEWLVANGADSCGATVLVKNATSGVQGLKIEFSLPDTDYGSFDQLIVYTDTEGKAGSTFKVNHKSGTATLKATITDPSGTIPAIAPKECTQKIDHDTPWVLSSYDVVHETTVGTIVPITMVYQDRWGNIIDDKRVAETVTFMVSAPKRAVFQLSNDTVAVVSVNENGEAVANLVVSERTSINTVRVNPDMGSVPDKYFFIQGVAERAPVDITLTFDPYPPKVSIKGDPITITYTVIDKFGNGIGNTPVTITTSIGEDYSRYTDSVGQIVLLYGPKNSIGNVVFKATATDPSGNQPNREDTVYFVAQDIQTLQFTANPSVMPSRDVDGTERAVLRAKLIDQDGNPVVGETVTFTLGVPVYENPDSATVPPDLETTSAVTDSDGTATVYFRPGGFSDSYDLSHTYDETASGSCDVIATWADAASGMSETRTLLVSWKNFPYLSIETNVHPQTVKIGETVVVTIRVKGDGFALKPTPIDAVLCTDRSGSMLKDVPDRMVSVMKASKAFTEVMQVNPYQDHIGLVSFGIPNKSVNLSPEYRFVSSKNGYFWDWTKLLGVNNFFGTYTIHSKDSFLNVYQDSQWDTENYNNTPSWPYTLNYNGSYHQQYIDIYYPGNKRYYTDYAVVESHLATDTTHINSAIDTMVPGGGTPLRYGLYKSINEIRENGREGAIRTVIVLSDGDYNNYGDPLARGTSNNGDPAKAPYEALDNVTPTLQYWRFADLNDSEQNLSYYAQKYNITIYSIGYAGEMSQNGTETLRILAESTGGKYYEGNATNIAGIYASIAEDLNEEAGVETVMELSYDSIEINNTTTPMNNPSQFLNYIPATMIDSYYANKTRPLHTPLYPYPDDQAVAYNQTKKLNFNIGTVKLGQTWEAQYTLQVLANGTMNVFGHDSTVIFNGTEGLSQIMVPKTYVTGIEEMQRSVIDTPTLAVPIEVTSQRVTTDPGYIVLS